MEFGGSLVVVVFLCTYVPTVQYSTVQYSTVQYSSVQYSSVVHVQ